jgi:co-chaperonin GroES (HSP10)
MKEEKKINFKALGKAVIVLKPEIKQETESGIFKGEEILKEERKLKENTYLEVLAVGSDVVHVKVGDFILASGTLNSLVIDDVECGYLYEPSIVGIKL